MHNWKRYFGYFENDNMHDILDKLDNWSLFRIYQHFNNLCCDIWVRGKGFYYHCLEVIVNIAKKRDFDVWVKQDFVEENPIAPLKKYRGESWVNHPLE